jgi:ubiquinone/menaquinone biosynthesis C-methylase UbiE
MINAKPVKKWIKNNIKNVHKEFQINKKEISPDEYVTYFPFSEESNSYVISDTQQNYELCEQGLPIPPKNLWLGYGENNKQYLSGKRQIVKMIEILDESSFNLEEPNKILDFGCGAGRMIRWLYPYTKNSQIWGTDIGSDMIVWAKKYLNPPFNFLTNTTTPALPFESKYFNLIYAGSVFTHIDDLVEAWFLELNRILEPEGRIFITIQDNHSIKLLNESKFYKNIWLAKYLRENDFFNNNKNSFEKLVCMRGTRSQVFYNIDYFCNSVSSYFEVISVNQEAYGFQTGVLLKKRIK